MRDGSVAIVGTGVMGLGIARLCRSKGLDLVVLSSSVDRARRVREELLAERGSVVSTDRADLARCSVLVEATAESLLLKQRVLAEAEPSLTEDAMVATTTSSLSITQLASVLERPGRFLGLHFFNPVHRIPLVEVVAGMRTEEAAMAKGAAFARLLGKHPLAVKDRAGFLVNRLLIPYLNQAARLVEEGFATAEDVDLAMRLRAGHPIGPFGLMDLIGADVCLAIGRSLFDEYKRPADAPSPELARRVALGLLGRKSGQGYYRYERKRRPA